MRHLNLTRYFLLIAMVPPVAACRTDPSEEVLAQIRNDCSTSVNDINSRGQCQFRLIDIGKNDGRTSEKDGVEHYTIFYTAHVEYSADCYYSTSFGRHLTTDARPLSFGKKYLLPKGTRVSVTDDATFAKSESGWRFYSPFVKRSCVVLMDKIVADAANTATLGPRQSTSSSSSSAGSVGAAVPDPTQAAASDDPKTCQSTTQSTGHNATAIQSTRASSSLRPNPADAAFDGSDTTAWCEAAPGDGAQQWIEATFKPGFSPTAIEVTGGWAYNSPIAAERGGGNGDMWELSNVATELEISWDGGSTRIAFNRTERGIRKRVDLPGSSKHVRITATAVSRGSGGNNLCLDGLTLFGTQSAAAQ